MNLYQYPAWLPAWAASLLLMSVLLGLALLIHHLGVRLVRQALARTARRGRGQFWRPFVIKTKGPTRLALIILALGWAVGVAPLSADQIHFLRHALLIGFILLLGWTTLIALDIGAALHMRRYRVDVDDNLLARKHLTQVRILRRALATLVIVVTIALAMMTISGIRQWGISLLAAGGAAGIIVGLALQPLLTNLIAGIQIAITQPIRIDDAVVVEGESGKIEEISATYVVVRLWDWRRMVLPLSYFIQNPFQNWTREAAELIGSVMIYVDYGAPLDAMRRKLQEIVEASPLWDGKVVSFAVTDARERTLEIRCLASARNSGDTFDLRCEIREKMITFLQSNYPHALPQDRLAVRTETSP